MVIQTPKAMANTYTQIYLHVVFSTKHRIPNLELPWRKEVHKYIAGIITEKGHKSIIVNGVEDHVHLFMGLKPFVTISTLIGEIKSNYSNFINKSNWVQNKFAWQEGYGAFSYAQSQIQEVYNYILQQEEHHNKFSFEAEYKNLLEKFEIDVNPEYVFD